MASLKLNYNTAVFKLCFDTRTSGKIVGRRLREPVVFYDLPAMLLKIDAVMDMQDYPRAFQRKRQFDAVADDSAEVPCAREADEMMGEEEVGGYAGELVTLLLQVMTRQNATWQGSIGHEGERHMFESVLQLLEHIDKITDRQC